MPAYLRGKGKIARFIQDILNMPVFDGMHYAEPFLGAANVLQGVCRKASYTASDKEGLLIHLLNSVRDGKEPPVVGKEKYDRLHKLYKSGKHDINLETATAMFIYSWNAKPWGGYNDTYNRNGKEEEQAGARRRGYMSLRESETFMKAAIKSVDYRKIDLSPNSLIYCDPPYGKGVVGYPCGAFDSDAFWGWVIDRSREGHIVIVSEYNAPSDFVCVAEMETMCAVSGGEKKKTRERLFMCKPDLLPPDLAAKLSSIVSLIRVGL